MESFISIIEHVLKCILIIKHLLRYILTYVCVCIHIYTYYIYIKYTYIYIDICIEYKSDRFIIGGIRVRAQFMYASVCKKLIEKLKVVNKFIVESMLEIHLLTIYNVTKHLLNIYITRGDIFSNNQTPKTNVQRLPKYIQLINLCI